MESHGVFAEAPTAPDPIIAQVSRQLVAEYGHSPSAPGAELDRVARDAVLELWTARVKTFVPVLALRDAREALGNASSAAAGEQVRSSWRRRDTSRVDDDVFPFDPADRLTTSD